MVIKVKVIPLAVCQKFLIIWCQKLKVTNEIRFYCLEATFAAFILIILPSAITIVWKNLHHSICRFICYRDKPSNMIDKKFVTDSPPSLLWLWKVFSFLTSVDYSGVLHDIEQFVSRQTGEQICHLVIGPGITSSQTLSSNQCSFMDTNWREVNIISAICRFIPKLDML